MTTPTYKVRLSPSGRKIGNPPLLTGTGSTGRIWRRHGAGAATAITPTVTALAAIPTLDAIAVDIRPGYLYDAQVEYEMIAAGLTATVCEWQAYYRVRNAATSAWGSWVSMDGASHAMISDATATITDEGMFSDAAFNVSTTVTCNAIEFGLLQATASLVTVVPGLAFARIIEYAS